MRINLFMKSVSNESGVLIWSVCFSISFSSLVKLSVFCEVGTLFSSLCHCGFSYCLYYLVLPGHRRLMMWRIFEVWGSGLVISLALGLGYLLLCNVL